MGMQPKLRFKGFTDDWEKRQLGEHSNILTGGTPKTSMINYWSPKEIPWMSSGEVNKKRLNETDNMISKEGLENSSARWVKENSIVIALAGQGKTRGMVAVNNIPLTTNQSIAAIEPDETLNFEFIFQNLSKRYDELRMMSSGDGTRGGLNKKIIYDITIAAPILEEQQKIGTFFKKLDDIIAVNQRKVDLLKKKKTGYLQKLFPKNGQNNPELRFKGFTDAWEKRKLGDIMDVTSVKRIHQSDWTTTGVPFYRARDLVSLSKNAPISEPIFIDKDTYEDYSKKSGKVKSNELLVTGVGTLGVAYLVPNDKPLYFKDGNVIWFRNNTLNGNFLYYSFMTTHVQKFIKLSAGTGTVGTYTIESGKNTTIGVPIKNDNKKLVSYFKSLIS